MKNEIGDEPGGNTVVGPCASVNGCTVGGATYDVLRHPGASVRPTAGRRAKPRPLPRTVRTVPRIARIARLAPRNTPRPRSFPSPGPTATTGTSSLRSPAPATTSTSSSLPLLSVEDSCSCLQCRTETPHHSNPTEHNIILFMFVGTLLII